MTDFDWNNEMPSSCIGCGCPGEIFESCPMIDFDKSCKMTFGTVVFQTPVFLIVILIKKL